MVTTWVDPRVALLPRSARSGRHSSRGEGRNGAMCRSHPWRFGAGAELHEQKTRASREHTQARCGMNANSVDTIAEALNRNHFCGTSQGKHTEASIEKDCQASPRLI